MSSRAQHTQFLGGALTAICEFMCSYGIPKSLAVEQFQLALQRGYSKGISRLSQIANPINEMASLCSHWHFNKKYIDKVGSPKPLTWNGRTGTLLKLAQRIAGQARATLVVKELVSRRLIRKIGRQTWVPKVRVIPPGGLDSAQILRASSMIEALIRTIAHNSKRKYRGDDLLMEVEVQVPRLPARELRNFKKFSKSQGLNFAKTMDDWLESRNVSDASNARRSRTSLRNVGVIIAAFERPTRKAPRTNRQDAIKP